MPKRSAPLQVATVVLPLGPPTNLRPAGAHEDKRRKSRDFALSAPPELAL